MPEHLNEQLYRQLALQTRRIVSTLSHLQGVNERYKLMCDAFLRVPVSYHRLISV